ncbi:sarcosine oxidase subunit alpha [Sphingomonas sp. BE270]|jgi:glycine cleavage system aminomethyltransferase T/NADPH-dependent 2,4-dienoyl-CoA reductase/sulfur reductase-like enzyme|uniref:2Fe-2S iron-sulfur cluster-binding protein n=1 Tax=unclassified Sphingomonas TaxID=196159 RepID=UPI0010F79E6A|nr:MULTISPECIES: 2Fe-2S iron-sulfur cluster-binding protein [unclassified Sphingomonas]MDR7256709.1 sarcosine oxidase subunit alpha [Sphingomonas sp. BE270]
MSGPSRLPGGPEPTLRFTFDGVPLRARTGDTLAAELLANGIGLVARSFKYHRPRGILSAGVEEPNALVTVGEGGRREPNTRATDVYVYDGLVAHSQNRWPSLAFDLGAINGLAARFLTAGFYYKTFFGPPSRWLLYERFIRRAAGLGKAPTTPDPDPYEHRSAFCDVLVVGGGPAGIAAARAGVQAGERVLLVEQDRIVSEAIDEARVLTRTTATGVWDHGFVTLVQRLVEPGQSPAPGQPAQRLWHVRARRIVLATGAIERPLTFAGNDRPGVMLSQAVRRYIERFKVLPGQRVVIATNNDDAYATADAIAAAGGTVVAILDSRAEKSAIANAAAHPVHTNAFPISTSGRRHHLHSVEADIWTECTRFEADLLAVSGGFTPVVHLHSQAGGALDWHEEIQAFVPGASRQAVSSVGAAAGDLPPVGTAVADLPNPKTSFIDFQNDVTAADIDLAWTEGYRSVEHLKRYTTLGMATDQGKTSNMAALARLASVAGVTIPQAGLTTFRAPFTPVTLGALAGADGGGHAAPSRRLALYDRHQRLAPLWQPLGLWHRPRAYPVAGETLHQAAVREACAVRTVAGIVDISTLAKFAVVGPDAAALLESVCATGIAKLAVGRGRYTFMLREDGMVMDDGTVWRLEENRYLLTSSTGGAERMEAHLSYAHRVLAPHLRVSVVAQQEHFAGIALAGPCAKDILAELTGITPPAHMGLAYAEIAGVPVLILAASYSGERAFELYAVASDAGTVWDALETATRARGGAPYGLEALEFLRIEKGHIVIGAEADGRTTPHDLQLERMLRKSGGFIGAAGLTRPALSAPDRLQLVGLTSDTPIPEGAMLVTATGEPVLGHVTSATGRVLGEGAVALGLLAGGRMRIGESLVATSPTRSQSARVTVTAPLFYDAEGTRYRD